MPSDSEKRMFADIVQLLAIATEVTVKFTTSDGGDGRSTWIFGPRTETLGDLMDEASEEESVEEEFDGIAVPSSPVVFKDLHKDNIRFGNKGYPGYRSTGKVRPDFVLGYLAPVPRSSDRKSNEGSSWAKVAGPVSTADVSVPEAHQAPVVSRVCEDRICKSCPKRLRAGFMYPVCPDCHRDQVLRESGQETSVCGDEGCSHLTIKGNELCKGCYRQRLIDRMCVRANCRKPTKGRHKSCYDCHLADPRTQELHDSRFKADVKKAREHQKAQASKYGGKVHGGMTGRLK